MACLPSLTYACIARSTSAFVYLLEQSLSAFSSCEPDCELITSAQQDEVDQSVPALDSHCELKASVCCAAIRPGMLA